MKRNLTAIIEKEGAGYVSLCPELDIASQGDTIQEAKENLKEALDLFFECASQEEISQENNDRFTRLQILQEYRCGQRLHASS